MRFGNDIAIVTLSLFATLAPGVYSQDSARGEKGEKKTVSTQVSAPDESELESIRKQSQVFVSAFKPHFIQPRYRKSLRSAGPKLASLSTIQESGGLVAKRSRKLMRKSLPMALMPRCRLR